MTTTVSSLARRVAAGGLRRVRDGADRARTSLLSGGAPVLPADQPAEQPPPEPPASDEGSYGELWNPQTVTDALAQIYNTTDMAEFEAGGRRDSEWVAPLLTPDATVLDLGCGIGRVAYYVAPQCRKLWAVDASPRMLELARERLAEFDNVSFARCQDVEIPDVDTGSVDVAYSLIVLQHLEREDAFLLLEELHRIVRPGGRVLLTFPNLLSDTYLKSFVDDAHRRATTHRARARVYTPQEVERVVRAAGFEDLTVGDGTEIGVTARRP